LHYGTAVFEGIRAYETDRGPAIFRHLDHLERLRRSASMYYMDLPFTTDERWALRLSNNPANKSLPLVILSAAALARYSVIAFWASSGVDIVTKAKPRERPLIRSIMMLASTTVPCAANASCRSFSVVLKERFPTNSLLLIFDLLLK